MSNYTGPLLTPEEQAQALHALVKVVGDSNIEHINGVASVVWVSYDILLTMRQEVDLMWK
ncbi:hypothetical protein BC629DRAFT_1592931 [Irpex lacteus]|nr:hypothetical protein BC629DRAFT_1592931 [Irpex lacteus]